MDHGYKQQACTELLGCTYPVIQGGMVWVSGANLAAAVSEAGGLGVIGAGSMSPDLLRSQIRKAKQQTNRNLAVNFPLLYGSVQEQIDVALSEGIRTVITSAGSPERFTKTLKGAGCRVLHVVSTPKLAQKCEIAGVDAVICEGFEAGGHNGREEITTMVLVPQVVSAVRIPVLAAGGIATGSQMAAAFALGAWGVQIGTAFAATQESSAHLHFKQSIQQAGYDATMLCMKSLVPVRLLKNSFYHQVKALEDQGADTASLATLLGKGRARAGMHEGDLIEGELEIGQVAALVHDIPTVKALMERLLGEYHQTVADLTPDLGSHGYRIKI